MEMLGDINLQWLVHFMFGMCLASTNTSHPSKDHHKFYEFHILLILFLTSTRRNAAFTPVHAVLLFITLDLSGWFFFPLKSWNSSTEWKTNYLSFLLFNAFNYQGWECGNNPNNVVSDDTEFLQTIYLRPKGQQFSIHCTIYREP